MTRVYITFLILPLLLLSSCSQSAQSPLVNSPEELAKIKVNDISERGEPKLDIDPNINLLPEIYSVIDDGIGNTINDTDRLQIKTDTYQNVNGEGYKVVSSAWSAKADNSANILTMSNQGSMPGELYNQLIGKRVGAIFIVFTGSQNNESGSQSKYIMVNKVVGKEKGYTTADGEVMPVDAVKPNANLASDNSFILNLPVDYKAPNKLDSYYLVKGTGPKVKSTDTVVVKYAGWLTSGALFDSKTDSPFVASLKGSVIKGWTNGLSGKTVGSRVMIIIPPALGYGSNAIGNIPPNSTLIFCVDILGIN
ncbi:MAG: FKBP-type peptidyl-prolyl cis-trans isomerase [Bifidobacteriaceae bacterium]|jgi:peptidylprolyl isomerase|nr:FKBP-type peptidyl-prolyl cis-trans isomerase [Bifidobacteriaceae bacterium]